MRDLTLKAAFLAVICLALTVDLAHARKSTPLDEIRSAQQPPQPYKVYKPSTGSESGAMAGMTAAHNQARNAVGKGLPALTWDPKIATYATEWANVQSKNCAAMKHRSGNPYGENMAGGSGSYKAPDVVSMWLKEKADFDHATQKCKPGKTCGHYTQIIWKKTTKLGCGYAVCDCSNPSNCWGAGSTIWVCNYSPPGNYSGETPY